MEPNLYDYPLYYDIAFRREVEPDVDFLEACLSRWRQGGGRRVLELGCGPGYHTLGFARRGFEATGLDKSSKMVAYARRKGTDERSTATFIEGDMFDFQLDKPVDLILSLMATATHITTVPEMEQHLKIVAANLTPDGLYILELPHPRDYFSGAGPSATLSDWSDEKDGVAVRISWREPAEPVDPIRETKQYTLMVTVTEQQKEMVFPFSIEQAIWTPKEMEALAKLSGCFHLRAMHGEFDINQNFNNSKWSWRMIVVLQRHEPAALLDRDADATHTLP